MFSIRGSPVTLRVILNADDLGYEPEVTRGIVLAMREGIVSSATVMVNSPFSKSAVSEARGLLPLGLHLNFVRFQSLSEPGIELTEAIRHAASWLETEALAQLSCFEKWFGRRPTHLDVHKHAHQHPHVLQAIIAVAQHHKLPVRSIDEPMRRALNAAGVATNDVFCGGTGPDAWWTVATFLEQLKQLPADGLVEMMCHPGFCPTDISSSYGPQREIELQTFLAPECRHALKERGLTLSSWS